MNEQATHKPLDGFNVAITGGNSEIGAAIAARLGHDGAKLVLIGRDRPRMDRTVQQLAAAGHTALPVLADLRDPQQAVDAIHTAAALLNGIDAVVHCAGIAHASPVDVDHVEGVSEMLDVNMRAPFVVTAAALPWLRQSTRGAVVFVSSLAAIHTAAHSAMYCATRRGMLAFAEALYDEVRHHGIKVTTILPSFVSSPKLPDASASFLGRAVLDPSDVAAAVSFGLTQPSRVCPSTIVLRVQLDPWRTSDPA